MEDIAVLIDQGAMCRVLGNAAVTRDDVTALMRQAATHATHTERPVAHLHRAELQAQRDIGRLDETLSYGVEVVGEYIFETDSGELDAQLETQIEWLRGGTGGAAAWGPMTCCMGYDPARALEALGLSLPLSAH